MSKVTRRIHVVENASEWLKAWEVSCSRNGGSSTSSGGVFWPFSYWIVSTLMEPPTACAPLQKRLYFVMKAIELCVCMCLYARARTRERGGERERKTDRMCVCVCVRAWERERERERKKGTFVVWQPYQRRTCNGNDWSDSNLVSSSDYQYKKEKGLIFCTTVFIMTISIPYVWV
jgi:hypothetical protein